jgi:DNA processing protein
MLTDRERLMAVNLVPQLAPRALRRLRDACGGYPQLLRAGRSQLAAAGLSPELAARVAEALEDEARVRGEERAAALAGARLVTAMDEGYPAALLTIHDSPPVLYVRGAWPAEAPAVAVVGSRHASAYGLQCAERLAYELALRGVTIVSGLARGIDAAAHKGALAASGTTVAVLGSGFSHLYPREHAPLAAEIAQRGAVITEYPMDTLPLPHHFPRRNRIISGLSLGVVVVEASGRSGALGTADCALEQGREVFAVPGPVTSPNSQGTHQLLKQGAALATCADDICETLRLTAGRPPQPPSAAADIAGMDSAARRVLACFKDAAAQDMDRLAAESGLPLAQVHAALLQLELAGQVVALSGKRFRRAAAQEAACA